MEKKSLIISILALAIAIGSGVFAFIKTKSDVKEIKTDENKSTSVANPDLAPTEATEGSIVYFQLDRVMKEYDMANDLTSAVEEKMQQAQRSLTSEQQKLQKDFDAFNEKWQKGLMTQSTAQTQAEKLDKRKSELEKKAMEKQNEMLEEQQVTMNQIMDAIQTYISQYNTEKGYAMILANQTVAPIMSANSGLDITDEIIEGLNKEYIESKTKKD